MMLIIVLRSAEFDHRTQPALWVEWSKEQFHWGANSVGPLGRFFFPSIYLAGATWLMTLLDHIDRCLFFFSISLRGMTALVAANPWPTGGVLTGPWIEWASQLQFIEGNVHVHQEWDWQRRPFLISGSPVTDHMMIAPLRPRIRGKKPHVPLLALTAVHLTRASKNEPSTEAEKQHQDDTAEHENFS